ncbi:TPA: hypothetical protein PDS32_001929 [Staphylococcus aureus]|nr:hypothetical protein [Staphylococcus aureus]HDE3999572.1 hypothetical protein [Staphylococcus aureus]HDE5733338.1 hypothetical protein [Staphylococcus aureus]HDE6589774.1 hypothetical protein [Staphylococcus aureus]HDF1347143.1 hypothetical protein [Staphylococcus aureus]
MNGILIKCLNIGGQYYLQTRMLSNVDNAEKIISRNSILTKLSIKKESIIYFKFIEVKTFEIKYI